MPRRGWAVGLTLVVIALPMLIPWNVVGTMWQIFARADIGLFGAALNGLGLHYNDTQDPVSAWVTIVVIDVWHWTPLVILLSYAGLRAIPDAFYQAARIDGASRWSVFLKIELPKLQRVLVIAVLLRFMQSFMIYTEPFVVTGGGPGNATTFLSIDLVKIALGQVDLGSAAAMSLVYYLITITLCWIFFTEHDPARSVEGGSLRCIRGILPKLRSLSVYLLVPVAADLLAHQHELADQRRHHVGPVVFGRGIRRW